MLDRLKRRRSVARFFPQTDQRAGITKINNPRKIRTIGKTRI
jgi:hypothetical protein